MSIFDLSGRAAVITGGNGGIGLGIAQALATAGCNVSIWGRNAEKNKGAAATMAARPGVVGRVANSAGSTQRASLSSSLSAGSPPSQRAAKGRMTKWRSIRPSVSRLMTSR